MDKAKTIEEKLAERLKEIVWRDFGVEYGSVKLQIRAGALTTVAIERTIKMD